jgi:hypothetical protein
LQPERENLSFESNVIDKVPIFSRQPNIFFKKFGNPKKVRNFAPASKQQTVDKVLSVMFRGRDISQL